jgi:hypothetical protein
VRAPDVTLGDETVADPLKKCACLIDNRIVRFRCASTADETLRNSLVPSSLLPQVELLGLVARREGGPDSSIDVRICSRPQIRTQERSLPHVSATRARRKAIVTCHNEPGPWLPEAGS